MGTTSMRLLQSLRQLQHLQVMCAMSGADPPQLATESEVRRIERLLTFLSSLPAAQASHNAPLNSRLCGFRMTEIVHLRSPGVGGRESTETFTCSVSFSSNSAICENDES